MKLLITRTDTYRVGTVAEVEQLHEQLKASSDFTLASFGYKTKEIKAKGEVLDTYQLVTVKKIYNDEKNPDGFGASD